MQPASFKTVQILYVAMFAGQVILGFIMYFLMQGVDPKRTPEPPFNMIIPGAAIIGIMVSYLMGQHKKKRIPENGTLKEKQQHFQTSKILQFAIAEGWNLISLILTFIMANTQYLVWFGIGLAAFVLLRPTRESFMEDYQIGVGEEFE